MGAIGCALHVALVSSFLAVSSRAESVPTEKLEEARGWYRDGLSLEAAGDWARALARFERVAEVRLTPQVRFHVARCKEHLGRFTEALGEYRISEYEAERDGLVELAEITQARQSLEARVPKLELRRGTGAERAAVRLDGVELGQRTAQFGVDPGPHLVTATKPGWRDFEYAFVADEGARIVVEITLDALPVSPPDHRDASRPEEPIARLDLIEPVIDRDLVGRRPRPLLLTAGATKSEQIRLPHQREVRAAALDESQPLRA